MPRVFRAAIVLSLAFHFLLLMAMFWGQRQVEERKKLQMPLAQPNPIEVEWAGEKSLSGARGFHPNGGAKLSLSALGIRYDVFGKTTPQSSSGISGENVFERDHGSGTSAVRYLFERLQGNIGYPEEFRLALMEGHVSAELVFNEKGEWDRGRSRFDASSNFFRVHVMQQLRRALREPIPKASMPSNGLSVHCDFEFRITEHNDERLAKSLNYYSGRSIAFYRHWQHSRLQIDLGPIHGFLGAPFIGLDLIDAVKRIGGLFSNKSKKDPLQKFRDDPEWSS